MPLALDSLVELLDQYSDVYPRSPTGALGWVRARREMPKSDPEVYIEWDKDHWRYHGEKDGWTFEHHFRLVPAEREPITGSDLVAEMLTEAQERVDADRCAECGEFHPDDGDLFLDELAQGQEEALNSDSFLILAVSSNTDPADGALVFEPSMHSYSLTPEAKAVLEAQLVHFAVQVLDRDLLRRLQDNESGQ